MSFTNRIGGKIEELKSEPEITIEKNIYEIKSDHMKKIYSLDMKISAIGSKK